MSTVNLYDVLDVAQDCSIRDIKNAYRKLVQEFHPDKPGGNAELFELVAHAYNILVNPTSRSEYDEIYALSKQVSSSHFDLKSKSKGYYKAQETDITTKKTKGEQEHDFKKVFEDMDKKHNYKRNKEYEVELSEKETKSLLRDLELAREQDDIEHIHEKIFDDGRFDIDRFNEAFDAMNKGPLEMIPHSGNPDAYNMLGGYGSNFSSIDNYDDLYAEDDNIGGSLYGSVKLTSEKKKKLSKDDVNKLSGASYTKGHNYRDKDYNKTLEQKMQERNMETEKFKNREMNDFDTDPNCGGYGIFGKMGMKNLGTMEWDNDEEDLKLRYNRLLEMRKQ